MNKKLTVLEYIGTMNRGGAETMLMDLLRQLHSEFNFVILVQRRKNTNPHGDYDEELRSLGIPLFYIDAVRDIGVVAFEQQFRKVVSQVGTIDIVHSHLNSKGGIVSRCAYHCGINKRIVHSHAKIQFDGNFVRQLVMNAELRWEYHLINRYATDYWGCSPEAMKSLFTKKHIACKHAAIIHNAIDTERFYPNRTDILRNELIIPKEEPLIVSVGRIASVKNYEMAAKIILELWQRGIPCHYAVAGRKQDMRSVSTLFSLLGNDRRFHYLGTRSDTNVIYNSADLYLGTSHREGLGISAVEAQACALPCVLSTGFPKLCDINLKLLKFVDSEDVKDWADQIQKLLASRPHLNASEVKKAVQLSGFEIRSEAERVRRLYMEDCNAGTAH